MSESPVQSGTALDPVQDWAALQALPEGAALADAYLTLRSELQTLITYCQAAESEKGMSLKGLREHAEALLPLLGEKRGKAWTTEYFRMSSVVWCVGSDLNEYVAGKSPYFHHWYIERARRRLAELDLPELPETSPDAQAEASLLRTRFNHAVYLLDAAAQRETLTTEQRQVYRRAADIVADEYRVASGVQAHPERPLPERLLCEVVAPDGTVQERCDFGHPLVFEALRRPGYSVRRSEWQP